jgi:hypothetical protein
MPIPQFAKAASARFEHACVDLGLTKEALNPAILTKGLQFAAKNPGLVGAGVGAVGGALMAPRDAAGNKNWVSGALGGAALGGAVGHAGVGIGKRLMRPDATLGGALKGYGTQVGRQAKVLKGRAGQMFQGTPAVAGA